MTKKSIVSKSVKYLMLASILGTTGISLMVGSSADASQLSPVVTQELKASEKIQNSAITYVDADGYMQVMPIEEGAVVSLSGTKKAITVKVGKEKTKIEGAKEVIFKGITIAKKSHLHLTTSIEKIKLDNVKTEKGFEIKDLPNLDTFLVKDSSFGSESAYSMKVHGNDKLTSYIIDNTKFEDNFYIHHNDELEVSYISNSVFDKNVRQEDNKEGYYTQFVGNTFVRDGRHEDSISSGGKSEKDIFFINEHKEIEMGATRYNAEKEGKIKYILPDGEKQKYVVPVGVDVETVVDKKDTVIITLTNGEVLTLQSPKSLTFKNVNITKRISFQNKKLKLENLAFNDCKTATIDIAHVHSLKTAQFFYTHVGNGHNAHVNIHDNDGMEMFVVQDSVVDAKLRLDDSEKLTKYVLNNVLVPGYMNADDLGETVLEISNSKFDHKIYSSQTIGGEAGRMNTGDEPVLTSEDSAKFDPFVELTREELMSKFNILAMDDDDGDITKNVTFEGLENVDIYTDGTYEITIVISDSDQNIVKKNVQLVIGY
ncbi:DUF5011/hyalin repeat domain-containing protein [Vagococcus fessus]|uniref:Pesticidal crystal protein Cry22Aa Ig-like domain-containing protein n=1 Tax=Vagococcus fessus TaxID=120370 RepID=A0A430A7W1_9ENTE|nr:hypothetical protein [Vagococcus fessus]RSU03161.1 hypothetical protein CBF31_05440 [Vagococcus fessus]